MKYKLKIKLPPEDCICGNHPWQRFSLYPKYIIGGMNTAVWLFLWFHFVFKGPTQGKFIKLMNYI